MITTAKVTYDKIEALKKAGYKYKEIAEVLGSTENRIKKVVYEHRHPEKSILARKEKQEANREAKRKPPAEIVIPGTGYVIANNEEAIESAVGSMGDDKVKLFITYHLDMLRMRQGVDKQDVAGLYKRFVDYLQYCAKRNIMPNNMNAYLAIGIEKSDVTKWKSGRSGTPQHKQFAEDVLAFFSSIHEQGGVEGFFSPILTIWWQKAYEAMTDQVKPEADNTDPLGDRESAESIAAKWAEADVELPSD